MKKEQKYHHHTFSISQVWSGFDNYRTIPFHNGIKMHLQGWNPKDNPLPLRQLVYKAGNQKSKIIR